LRIEQEVEDVKVVEELKEVEEKVKSTTDERR
jgi:hypothetical protein